MIFATILLTLAYAIIWLGSRMGNVRSVSLEKQLQPIVIENIEMLTPLIQSHHEKLVAGLFLSLSFW